jgi:hypothetical protein
LHDLGWRSPNDAQHTNLDDAIFDGRIAEALNAERWLRDYIDAKGQQHMTTESSGMSLEDRIEFALRDAGFDYDEASQIAYTATHLSRDAVVPDGYVLVSCDALENCIDDANRFLASDRGWEAYGTGRDAIRGSYKAMLAQRDGG